MIAFLDGNLVEKDLTRAVIEVNGIGFELLIPMSTYDKLPSVGEGILLKVYHHVRQDLMQLFGFFTSEEKTLFLLLVSSVSGVGPKLALNILSSLPVTTFCNAIAHKDLRVLSRINGIGKRSAERLVIELKDRIQDIFPEAGFEASTASLSANSTKAVEDSVSGLITLGFKADSARKTVNRILEELSETEVTPEILIRRALIILNN